MGSQVVKLQSVYTPTLFQSPDAPLRGRYIFNLAKCVNNALAIGKHHYSTWIGGRIPDNQDPETCIHKTTITPSANAAYVYVVCLVEGTDADIDVTLLGTELKTVPFENESASTNPVASHLHELVWEYSVVGGVDLTIYLTSTYGFCIKGITVFDTPQSLANDGMTGWVDPTQFSRGQVLTNTGLVELITGQQTLVADLRKDHVHNATAFADESLWRGAIPADGRWYNVMDASYNTWNADAPGYWIRPSAAWDSDELLELTITVDAFTSGYDMDDGRDTWHVDEDMSLKAVVSDGSETQESDPIEIPIAQTTPQDITLYVPVPLDYHSDYRVLVQLFAKNVTVDPGP